MTPQTWIIKKGYADTQAGQIHYRRCGNEAPTVLLLHHTPGSSAMFTSALTRLAAGGISSAAIDLPNCGASFVTSGDPKLPELADAILEAVQEIGFPPAFNIVGHQVGASLAIHIAVQFPQLVKKLVLWGIPILGVMSRGDVLREEPPDFAGNFFGVIDSFVKERFPDEGYPWQLKVRGLIDMLQVGNKRHSASRPMALVDLESLLKKLKQPTLCMAGDFEPLQKSTMKAALLLSNGKYHNLSPAGCDVVDEFPDEYVSGVIDFLKVSGLPIERSSCTIPENKIEEPQRRASSHVGTNTMISSEVNVGDLGSDGFDISNGSSLNHKLNIDSSKNVDRRLSDSDRRVSGEKKRPTFRGLLKGKFS